MANSQKRAGEISKNRRNMLRSARARISPLVFFSSGPGRQGTPRKQHQQQQQQQHDSVSYGSQAIHRDQGVSVNPFGYPPSLSAQPLKGYIGGRVPIPPPVRGSERGGIYL